MNTCSAAVLTCTYLEARSGSEDFGIPAGNTVRVVPLQVRINLCLKGMRDKIARLPGALAVGEASPLAEVLLPSLISVSGSCKHRHIQREKNTTRCWTCPGVESKASIW